MPRTATARHLAIVKDDDRAELTQRVAEAVREFDAKIAPRDPSGSVVQVGTIEKFVDVHGGGSRVAYVMHRVGNEDIVVTFPMCGDTAAAERAVEYAIEVVAREMESRN